MTLKSAGLALAVLAMALGTAAMADPWVDNAGAPREHKAPPPAQGHLTYRIVVDKNGNKVSGSTGTSVFRSQAGVYIAEFGFDVTGCVYVATLGRTTRSGGVDAPAGYVTTVQSAGFQDGVFVATFDLHGRRHDHPFHLLVAC